MGIDMVITAGDRRHAPYYPIPSQEKPSPQGTTTGSFEDVLRLALANAK